MKLKYIFLLVSLSIFTLSYGQKRLVILHTNDTHSRIEPMPATDRTFPSMGGVINRKAVIDSVREVEKNILLIDAGDFVQGTPYFNMFHGRVETGAMNIMKYDVGTIGNHEFDYGLDTMKMMIERLKYPIVNCNYDFSATVLKDLVKPYIILKRNGIKIGILGVGVDPEGLIQKDKYEGMKFRPVIESVNRYAKTLKEEKKCDIIICVSHIGIQDDKILAESSRYINVIIGGHSHTIMDEPVIKKNLDGKDILIYQVGKNGAYIGKTVLALQEQYY